MSERSPKSKAPHQLKRKPAGSQPVSSGSSEAVDLENGLSPNQIMHLQHTIGNQAVQRLLAKTPPATGVVSRLVEAPGNLISRTGAAAEAPELEEEEVARMVEAPGNLISRTGAAAEAPELEEEEVARMVEAPGNLISRTGAAAEAPELEEEEVARMIEAPGNLISRTGAAVEEDELA